MNDTLTKFYVWSIKALLFVIPFLTLWIARSMYFPYITGRNFGFRILIELALILWVGLIVLRKEYRPKSSWLMWAMIAFLGVIGLADLLGINPYISFWSKFERMEGYMMLLHLGAYFFIASSVFRTKGEWLTYFKVHLLGGWLAGIFGILQSIGVLESIQGGFRIDGPVGNPTYFAGYLVLVGVLAAILFMNAQKRWERYVYGGSIVYFLGLIYFTASRGPILAIALGMFLYALWYLIFGGRDDDARRGLYRKLAGAFLLVSIVVPVIFWTIKDTSFIQSNPILSRFANISLEDKTTRSRFTIWNIALQGFLEKPVLGWGQDNFIVVFSKYYDPSLYDQEPWFDRAHNLVMDWLVNGGILGFLAYFSLYGMAFALVFRMMLRGVLSVREAGIIIVGLIMHIGQTLFVFDTMHTYILYFTIFAYVQTMATGEGGSGSVLPADKKRSAIVAGVAAVIILPALYLGTIVPLQQAQGMLNILRVLNNNPQLGDVQTAYQEAIEYGSFGTEEIREQLGRTTVSIVNSNNITPEDKVRFIQFAESNLEDAVAQNPNSMRLRLFLATVYNRAGLLDSSYADKALVHLEKAFELSPVRSQALYALADNYLLRGDFDTALNTLYKAVELAPDDPDANSNYARILIFAGRITEANELITKIVNENPEKSEIILRVIDAYIQSDQRPAAISIYERVRAIVPHVTTYYTNLAALYFDAGNYVKARQVALELLERFGGQYDQAVEDFLKEIEKAERGG